MCFKKFVFNIYKYVKPKSTRQISSRKIKENSNRRTTKFRKFRKTEITWKTRRIKKLGELEELEIALEELGKLEGKIEIEIKELERINEINIEKKHKLAINSNISFRIES